MEVDDVLRPPLLTLLAREERGSDTLTRELVARRPMREPEHPAPLAEHHHFTALRHRELTDQFAELRELWTRQAPKRGIRGPLDPRQIGPDLLKAQLGEAIGDDALRREQGSSDAGTPTA